MAIYGVYNINKMSGLSRAMHVHVLGRHVGYLVCCFVVLGYAKAFMCGWVQVESRCSHVSISWFGQSVQLGLGYVRGHKMFFWWFPSIGRIIILRFV